MTAKSNLFSIVRTFRNDGNKFTLEALWHWISDYHEREPQVAVNDNDPSVNPRQIETRIDAVSSDALVAAFKEDEKHKDDPKYKPKYSVRLHDERLERVKHAKKSAPPMPECVDAEAEMARYIDAKNMRAWLGADAETLDIAVEPDTTFHDVGKHIGAEGEDDAIAAAGKQEVIDVAKIFYDRHAA